MLSVLLLVLALAGCVSLTPDGERVRVVRNSNHVRDCRLLGNVESLSGHGGVAGDLGFENNKATMRNDTAKLGGDTLLVLEERGSMFPKSFGEAYRCAGATPSKPIGGTEAPTWCRGEKDTWDGHRCMTRN
jgi:hypothetical protein